MIYLNNIHCCCSPFLIIMLHYMTTHHVFLGSLGGYRLVTCQSLNDFFLQSVFANSQTNVVCQIL